MVLVLLVVAGVLAIIIQSRDPQLDHNGEIVFVEPRPVLILQEVVTPASPPTSEFREWREEAMASLLDWLNLPPQGDNSFGDHYYALSKEEIAAARLEEKADKLFERVLIRYPELTTPLRKVAPERNGFLQFVEFCERLDSRSVSGEPHSGKITFSPEVEVMIDDSTKWDSELAQKWLQENEELVQEIRLIGFAPDQSIAGLDVSRYFYINGSVFLKSIQVLMMEAKLFAEKGEVEMAMESVRCALGFKSHLSEVECVTSLMKVHGVLIESKVIGHVLTEVLPALPSEKLNLRDWESLVSSPLRTPADYAKVHRGEWYASNKFFLMPMLVNTSDPDYLSDPADFIDYFAAGVLQWSDRFSGTRVADWKGVAPLDGGFDFSSLSDESAQLLEVLVPWMTWNSALRIESNKGLRLAAFAILQGQPIPLDPIFGQPYKWNESTRELSFPDTEQFRKMGTARIEIPEL